MKQTQYEKGYKEGYRQAIIDTSWMCSDCSNVYESSVPECPNRNLDLAGITGQYKRTYDE